MVVVLHSRSFYLYCGVVAIVLLLAFSFTTPRQAALPTSAICKVLPTVSDDFEVTACRQDSYCNALDLIITRKSASQCSEIEEQMRKQPVSSDPKLSDFVRGSLGPDGFMIVVDGAERMARYVPDAYLGGCSYRFSLRFNNAGPMSLQIWHHYETYFSYWENNMEWPPQATERVMLRSPLYLEACVSCRSFVAPPSGVNATLLIAPPTAQPQPACSTSEPVYGSYIPVSYMETHNSLFNFYEPLPANQNAYKFVPAGNCQYTHDGLRYTKHDGCFSQQKSSVLLHGDSHQRVLYDGLVHRLSGQQWTLDESEKSGHKNATFDNLYLDFQWDPSGEGLLVLDCAEIQAFDVLVFSVGHHLHRYTTAQYFEFIGGAFEHVTKLSAECHPSSGRSRQLVYVTPPAVVPREDHFVQDLKDRRTNVRITHWANIGMNLARKHGWRTVDQFHYTAAFVRDSKDDAHFLETDALDAVLDDFIAKLGVCEPPPS
ncbi:hypothetical protein BKA62DRAFT_692573 [Auriculariales sp. MPI-PUGE-AT-0066]|nr:hypothetical protein BKA62DRAFT_692573 [Auriculariales sp. MPI-PUGE-AT-0066]